MTLRLVIEHSTHPQERREMRHPGGEFSIGRGADCNWQLNDPDMYVSRKHCVITGEAGQFIVTDASRGGLFIDGKDQPLGPGNSARLEQGMRIRLGDIVIKVEIEAPAVVAPPRTIAPVQNRLQTDDFFSQPVTPPPPVQRPENLPRPFDSGTIDARRGGQPADRAPPPMFDDPFSLDRSTPARPAGGVPEPIPARNDDFGFGSFFDTPAKVQPPDPKPADDGWAMPLNIDAPEPAPAPPPAAEQPLPLAAEQRVVDPLPEDESRTRQRVAVPTEPLPETPAEPTPEVRAAQPPARPSPEPPPAPPVVAPAVVAQPVAALSGSDLDLRAAFFKGLGLDPAAVPSNGGPDEMQALGERFRLLVEGLMLMLRTRAKEKQNARVAQTVISNTDVNPLKFLATTNEALAALIAPRGAGYLPPDQAINGAFRDLADHQVRSWVAIQSALRRMIDRFDPAAIERELVEMGMIEALLAGGRSAKLWKLYNDRYKDIARSAEDRFLGEVGADFREAYEGNKEKTDDQ